MGRLQDQFLMDMELRGFSPHTCRRYVSCVRGFVAYFKQAPEALGTEEIRTYLHYLTRERQLSQGSINQTYSALKLLYEITLGRTWDPLKLPRGKKPQTLPVIFSQAEVGRLFDAVSYLKHRVLLVTIYSAGLRVSEVTHLRVDDIDSSRMLIRVRQGKGKKDRYTLLAQRTLPLLRAYWQKHQPRGWLFPGRPADKPISEHAVQQVFRQALAKAQINKVANTHALRHSFATHLVEQGIDLCHIQRLLGHASIKTTVRYIHVSTRHITQVPSPLDQWEVAEGTAWLEGASDETDA